MFDVSGLTFAVQGINKVINYSDLLLLLVKKYGLDNCRFKYEPGDHGLEILS